MQGVGLPVRLGMGRVGQDEVGVADGRKPVVGSGPAVEVVVAGIADQGVIPALAVERVVSIPSEDDVVEGVPPNGVMVGGAENELDLAFPSEAVIDDEGQVVGHRLAARDGEVHAHRDRHQREVENVVSTARGLDDGLGLTGAVGPEGVGLGAAATLEGVAAGPAEKPVAEDVARQRVGAHAAGGILDEIPEDEVEVGIDHVRGGREHREVHVHREGRVGEVEGVRSAVARHGVGPERVVRVEDKEVAQRSADQGVVAAAALEGDRRPGVGAGIDHVVPRPPYQDHVLDPAEVVGLSGVQADRGILGVAVGRDEQGELRAGEIRVAQ